MKTGNILEMLNEVKHFVVKTRHVRQQNQFLNKQASTFTLRHKIYNANQVDVDLNVLSAKA